MLSEKREIEKSLQAKKTIIIVGNCRVLYSGRAVSELGTGERIVLIKPDGTFLVHQPSKTPPVNYQKTGTKFKVEYDGNELIITGKNGEDTLSVFFNRIILLRALNLHDNSRSVVRGIETHISDALSQDLEVIETGMKAVKREGFLPKGMVDIWAEDKQGNIVLIEVKRRKAGLNAVSQLKRYVEEVQKRKGQNVRGILCAPEITEHARKFLEKEGLEFKRISYKISETTQIDGSNQKQAKLEKYV